MVKKLGVGLIGGVVLLCLCGALLTAIGGGNTAPSAAPQATQAAPTTTPIPAPTDTPAPVATVSPLAAIEAAARQWCAMGFVSAERDGNAVTVTCKITADLGEGIAVGNTAQAMHKLAPVVMADATVNTFALDMQGGFVDKLGTASTASAIRLYITRGLSDKITYANLTRGDLLRLLRSEDGANVKIHPAWRAGVDAWASSN